MSTPIIHLVHPPPYGEVAFKNVGLCSIAAGLRRDGLHTRYHDVSERLHRGGDDFTGELLLRYAERVGCATDLPLLDLLGEVLCPEHGSSALADRIRAQAAAVDKELGDVELVAMPFPVCTTYFAAALGRRLRHRGVRVLFGGPQSAVRPLTELLLRLGACDAMLVGEADHTAAPAARALLGGRTPEGVPGALWLEAGAIRFEPAADPPAVEALPWPELQGNELFDTLPICGSRGCPRKCAYCGAAGTGHRRRSPAGILAEMEARAAETGILDFFFHDALLNANRAWLSDLLVHLRGRDFTWECFLEPHGVDRALLEQAVEAGCRSVHFGVQSLSAGLLRVMQRAPHPDGAAEAIALASGHGLETAFEVIIGHPGETEADHVATVERVEALFERTGGRLHLSPIPYWLAAGSAVAHAPERFGVVVKAADPADLPPALAEALRAGPPYPTAAQVPLEGEVVKRRLDELGALLRRHGRDYMYAGRAGIPDGARRARVPLAGGASRGAEPVRAAWERGEADACLPFVTLEERSNLKLGPTAGRLSPLVPVGAPVAHIEEAISSLPGSGVLRLLGGEPTLSADLPATIAAARHRRLRTWIETNGLRFAQPAFARALARRGLDRATVLLLATDEGMSEQLGGIEGGQRLALEGADELLAAGIEVELGLLVTRRSRLMLPYLVQLAAIRLPTVRAIRVVLTGLHGPTAPALPTHALIDRPAEQLVREARQAGLEVHLESRL